MPRCTTCGKIYHHSVILENGEEATRCLDCLSKAEEPRDSPRIERRAAGLARGTRKHGPRGESRHGGHHESRHEALGESRHGGHHHAHHHYDERDEQWKAWVGVGVLGLIAAVLVFVIWRDRSEVAAAARARAEAVEGILADFGSGDLDRPEIAMEALRRIEAARASVGFGDSAGRIEPIEERAQRTVRRAKVEQDLARCRAAFENGVRDPAGAEALYAEARQVLQDARICSRETIRQARELLLDLAGKRLELLAALARAQAGVAMLDALARAERAAAAMAADFGKDLGPSFPALRQKLVEESDARAKELMSESAIEQLPAVDLLSGELGRHWRGSLTDGFSTKVEAGRLLVENRPGGAPGVVATGYEEGWRDFAIDLEAEIEGERPLLFVRLVGAADSAKVPNCRLPGAGAVKGRVLALGDRVTFAFQGSPAVEVDVSKMERLGGIGILAPAGSRCTVRKMDLRLVR
ncbi:MAG: hypothetical protein Fur0037_13080 [Planctomycetota bacterium]